MRLPLDGTPRITTEYMAPGTGSLGKHLGIDYGVPVGTPVHAPGDGMVTRVYTGVSGGRTIEARIKGMLWRFLHLSEQDVEVGQLVSEGQVIGKTGATGQVTGPHLHVDVRLDGTRWNASLSNYHDPRTVIEEANKPQVKVPKSVYLKPTVSAYAFYRPGTPLPVKRINRVGELNPKKWGGITYQVIRQVAPNTYEVKSPSLGIIWVWCGDRDSEVRY